MRYTLLIFVLFIPPMLFIVNVYINVVMPFMANITTALTTL